MTINIKLIIFISILSWGCSSTSDLTSTGDEASNLYVLYSMETELVLETDSSKEWQVAAQNAMNKKSYYELVTNGTESIFNHQERIDNTQNDESTAYTVSFDLETEVYKNMVENYSLMAIETNTRLLLKDSLNVFDWILTGETKKLLGYEVRKAEAKDQQQNNLTAWYAPKLPYKNGPLFYGGLPGLILELELSESDSRTTFTAEKVETVNTEILKPQKGKEMWMSEFLEMQKKQMDKRREMHSSGVDKD